MSWEANNTKAKIVYHGPPAMRIVVAKVNDMILCCDVQYLDTTAFAAGIVLADWRDEKIIHRVTTIVNDIPDYTPGQFYRRELPALLDLVDNLEDRVRASLSCIVVDGFVHLGPEAKPGLGQHLYERLSNKTPVVGVAKTNYAGTKSEEVFRGQSARPLFITSVGIDANVAAKHVHSMHGDYRFPSALKAVDTAARELAAGV